MDAPESARGITGGPGFSMCPVLGFGPGEDCPVVCALTLRVPSVDVDAEKDEVMRRLELWIIHAARAWAPGRRLVTAEQTHGRAVAVIREIPAGPVPVVDALVTARRDVVLGIAVADCCPVWLWAPAGRGPGGGSRGPQGRGGRRGGGGGGRTGGACRRGDGRAGGIPGAVHPAAAL